jgi:hypothetical protein
MSRREDSGGKVTLDVSQSVLNIPSGENLPPSGGYFQSV